MAIKKVKFVPRTPGGTPLMDFAGDNSRNAWTHLIKAIYPASTKKDLIKRGYTVERWTNE